MGLVTTKEMFQKAYFTSVMIDGSQYDFEKNVEITSQVVEYAHEKGVVVEGELGKLAGVEDDVKVDASDAMYTHPDEVQEFVERTGVDSLAIAIGTSHGAFKFKPGQKPQLRFDILEEISRKIPDFPIVLHGASSVSQEYVKIIQENGGELADAIGIPEDMLPFWLKDTRINNWVLVASSIWRYMGQNMVLFIGAIASVDKTQYEAAAIDGANAWHRFRYIILPSIRTIVVLNMILAISGSLSVFEIPYVITDGGFGTSTYFVLMDKLAHANQKVGLASAMAVVLLVLILVVSGIQKLAEKKMNSGVRVGKRRARK